MIVRELMSSASQYVSPDACVEDVIRFIREHNSVCVTVCEDQVPVGLITERQILNAFSAYLDSPDNLLLQAKDIMIPEPVCVSEKMAMEDALVLANSRKAQHLPVVINSNQHWVGLVTQTDLLQAYLQLLNKETELESLNQELQLLCLEDPLLSIGNRRSLELDLACTRASCKRYQRRYSVALFDVDFFKQYNDQYGHLAGDDALKQVASAICRDMRTSDRLYRYGGEELLLLMPDTDIHGAQISARRAKKAVDSLSLVHEKSDTGYLTISAGVASSDIGGGGSLIKQADDALYRAKNNGRNQISVVTES